MVSTCKQELHVHSPYKGHAQQERFYSPEIKTTKTRDQQNLDCYTVGAEQSSSLLDRIVSDRAATTFIILPQ